MKGIIKGVELEINGQPILLPIEEAKKLQRELSDLLGDKTVLHYVPVPCYIEPPIYHPPLITFASTGTGAPISSLPITICGVSSRISNAPRHLQGGATAEPCKSESSCSASSSEEA